MLSRYHGQVRKSWPKQVRISAECLTYVWHVSDSLGAWRMTQVSLTVAGDIASNTLGLISSIACHRKKLFSDASRRLSYVLYLYIRKRIEKCYTIRHNVDDPAIT